jgi:stress-induced morphogen
MANYKLEGDQRILGGRYGLAGEDLVYDWKNDKYEWVRSREDVDEIRQKIDDAVKAAELRKREEEIKRRLEKDFRDYRLQVKDEGKKDEGQNMDASNCINVAVSSGRRIYWNPPSSAWYYFDNGQKCAETVSFKKLSDKDIDAEGVPPTAGPTVLAKALAVFTYPQMRELACELVDMFKAKEENGQKLDLLDWHVWAEFFNAWQEGEHKLAEIRAKAEEKEEEKD